LLNKRIGQAAVGCLQATTCHNQQVNFLGRGEYTTVEMTQFINRINSSRDVRAMWIPFSYRNNLVGVANAYSDAAAGFRRKVFQEGRVVSHFFV
jgi:hypothetical protein